MSSIIKIKNLTKKYKLYRKPLDRLKESLHPLKKCFHKEFLANNSISFEIKKGEVVGIVGKNGSGKSTLLKMITGVLSPSSGSLHVEGKITAMLELGAGFNPELSGMENLYLNGSISGYTPQQMEQKIDPIVSFADIGEFIHQPLKTYSSGMKSRLGFAFSIHIDPEILIIDEALSVGDVAFQRKCYAKIKDMCQSNEITVLFVSHSGSVIKQLCSRAIMLYQGEKVIDGNPKEVINLYDKFMGGKDISIERIQKEFHQLENSLSSSISSKTKYIATLSSYNPSMFSKSKVVYDENGAKIDDIKVTNLAGDKVNILSFGDEFIYSYRIKFYDNYENIKVAMFLKSKEGVGISGKGFPIAKREILSTKANQEYLVSWKFKNILNEGFYFFNCAVNSTLYGEKNILHRVLDAYMIKSIKNETNYAHGIVDMGIELDIRELIS